MESFQKAYPNVSGSYRGEGSSTAPPALIEGTPQLGPMSRAMKEEEEDEFEKKFGYRPTQIVVALDCLAVFVNKDNPIRGLTLPQVDCIFSSTRNSGYANITRWGEASLDDSPRWANLPISLYGRNSVSGTDAHFKKVALFKGDFKNSVKEQPGSAAVVNGVASERGAIGYSGKGRLFGSEPWVGIWHWSGLAGSDAAVRAERADDPGVLPAGRARRSPVFLVAARVETPEGGVEQEAWDAAASW